MRLFWYNLLLPIGFLGFLPGLLWKLWRRPGWKSTFGERFGHFSAARRKELLPYRGAVWIHAVSVGETMIALALLKNWRAAHPGRRFVLSTTTTTGQQLARDKAPEGVQVIFCPLDFRWMVRRTLTLLAPSMLVILETELWPNLIAESAARGMPLVLVNARLSDRSARGYRRFRVFFRPLLESFSLIAAQSLQDRDRFLSVAPNAPCESFGNLKFDQKVPAQFADPGLERCFGGGPHRIVATASTHPGEEALVVAAFRQLRGDFPGLKLLLIPRHAERGAELAAFLEKSDIRFVRRSVERESLTPVDCVLADTTGEMLALLNQAEIVVMGKTLAGHNEGQNPIEPALLGKPVISGPELRNFRFIMNVLKENDGIVALSGDAALPGALRQLLADPDSARKIGGNARRAVSFHTGATEKSINAMEKLLQ